MRRGQRTPTRGRYDRISPQQGAMPDLLSNLPKPSKRPPVKAATAKPMEKTHKEDGILFINVESSPSNDVTDNVPTTEEILEKAQEIDCNSVFEIDLRDRNLFSVPNLKKFPKTRILDLSSNKICRITYLFNVKDLRELKLYDNKIQMLEGFDDLRELNVLQMQFNELTSIGNALSGLKKLNQLRLDNNRIRKLAVKELCSCSQITSLDLSFNNLDSIDAVVCLPNLEELFASNNHIKVLPDLSRCKKLKELRMPNNRLADATGLKGASSLRILDISSNHVFGCKGVGRLSHLEYINFSNNNLQDITNFQTHFPNVDVFDLSENRLENFEDSLATLTQMAELSELSLVKNPMMEQVSMAAVSSVLPKLEMLDGQPTRRQSGTKRALIGTPVMRPMSASTVISAKFVENQLTALKDLIEPFEAKMTSCYSNLRESINLLPSESPSTARSQQGDDVSRPSTSSSRRRRIFEAQEFAKSMNFQD